ncbi:MAG: hypothetical protein ACJA08_001873 [Cyclobacteriaceae bacterium]|jgi:hypothetical protein
MPNYRFVCPQLLDSTKIARVHQNHNGNYKALCPESLWPELQKYPKAMKIQKVHWSGQVLTKLEKRHFGT